MLTATVQCTVISFASLSIFRLQLYLLLRIMAAQLPNNHGKTNKNSISSKRNIL